jgi:hypothetical protein
MPDGFLSHSAAPRGARQEPGVSVPAPAVLSYYYVGGGGWIEGSEGGGMAAISSLLGLLTALFLCVASAASSVRSSPEGGGGAFPFAIRSKGLTPGVNGIFPSGMRPKLEGRTPHPVGIFRF